MEVYKIVPYSDEFTNQGCQIDTAWVRNSSSDYLAYPTTDTLDPEISIGILSYPSGSGTIYFDTGYVFHVIANLQGDTLNTWFPNFIDTSASINLRTAITLYHSCPVGITEKNKQNDWVGNPIPNPAAENTTIEYSLTNNENLKIELYDISGRHLQTLHNEKTHKGQHTLKLNTSTIMSGIYFITFVKENHKTVRKLVVK